MMQVVLLAMEVSEAVLKTLISTSAALDIQEQRRTPLVNARDAVQLDTLHFVRLQCCEQDVKFRRWLCWRWRSQMLH